MFGIIFGNAAQGMNAFSHGMGTISQNIANVNTQGYKSKETLFQTSLSGSHASPATSTSGLNIFGVKVTDRYNIQGQGQPRVTSNWSDLAISGRGFFMVSPAEAGGVPPAGIDTNNPNSVVYSRDGSFGITPIGSQAYLTLGGNMHLMGWQADEHGNIDQTKPLSAVNYKPNSPMQGVPTTTGKLVVNLPAKSKATAEMQVKGMDVTFNVNPDTPVQVKWTRQDGNTWTVAPSISKNDIPGVEIIPPEVNVEIDAFGNADPALKNYPLTIRYPNPAYDPTDPNSKEFLEETQNIDLLATSPDREYQKVGMQLYDSNRVGQEVNLVFEHAGANKWYVYPGLGANVVDGEIQKPVLVEFNPDGTLKSDTPIDLAFSFLGGNPPVPSTANVAFDIKALTQYSTDLTVTSATQNGYPDGFLKDVQFDKKGNMVGIFDNGQARTLYRLPLATFVAENSLEPISGNMFRRTAAAGDITVASVDETVGSSRLTSYALEGSTVDIGDEFTKMIVTQRAYSSNAKVFTTADEMTTVARDLKS